jgi:UDP-4-amino-4,6-dideoxy-N-acetyl-beta-L-altrosamine transaminase
MERRLAISKSINRNEITRGMSDRPKFIPYGQHSVDDADIASVVSVLRSGALTNGPVVAEFEAALVGITGAKEAVSCSSGTAALHLAIAGLGLTHGDRVIVPTLTFLASANAARYVGADVVFADVDPSSGLMGPQHFEEALKNVPPRSVKAVISVHLNGQCCDMVSIEKIAREHGVAVVEDACHALGGHGADSTTPAAVGSCAHSDLSCFSFHPVKTVAMGEGGAVTTNNPTLAANMRRLRNHGMERTPENPAMPDLARSLDGELNPWYYEMGDLGWNFRASDIHCALGLSQLKKLEVNVARRAVLAARYDNTLKDLSPVIRPISRVGGDVAWHLYVVHIDFDAIGVSRAAVMNALEKAGIGTQVHYIPVHLQPYYQKLYGARHLSGAEKYYSSCLSLPLFPSMADSDVDRVSTELKRLVENS